MLSFQVAALQNLNMDQGLVFQNLNMDQGLVFQNLNTGIGNYHMKRGSTTEIINPDSWNVKKARRHGGAQVMFDEGASEEEVQKILNQIRDDTHGDIQAMKK